jgi:hypothetical protein
MTESCLCGRLQCQICNLAAAGVRAGKPEKLEWLEKQGLVLRWERLGLEGPMQGDGRRRPSVQISVRGDAVGGSAARSLSQTVTLLYLATALPTCANKD